MNQIPLAWLCLIGAGFCQTAWTYSLKFIQLPHLSTSCRLGLDRESQTMILAWMGYFIFGALNSVLLSIAMRSIATTSSFIVWTGFSLLVMSVCDTLWFKLDWSLSKLFFIGLILVGIVGLKASL